MIRLRKIRLADGLYIVGQGMSIPVADDAEAARVLDTLQPTNIAQPLGEEV